MGILKKNIKLIIGFVLGIVLASSVAIYATANYLATDVSYTRNSETTNVSSALNDLYNRFSTYKNLSTSTNATASDILSGKTAYDNLGNLITGSNNMNVAFQSISADSYYGTRGTNQSKSLILNRGKYIICLSVGQGWIGIGTGGKAETTNTEYLNFTCTKNWNSNYINTRKSQSGNIGSNNVNVLVYEDYYSIEILSDNSTITATWQNSAASVPIVLNITAIPYGIQ